MHSNSSLVLLIVILVLVIVVGLSNIYARRSGYVGPGGRTIVRCSAGHLFTTIWLLGGSFKAIRLGIYRFQYCPVGQHWALVRPVKPESLTESERKFANQHSDSYIP